MFDRKVYMLKYHKEWYQKNKEKVLFKVKNMQKHTEKNLNFIKIVGI